MRKNVVFLVVVLIIILGVIGYLKAIPSRGQAKIEISPKFYDFGQVEYGQVLEYTFKVKNIGSEVLEIKRVATSCGCTKADLQSQDLKFKPGEEVGLIVSYDTGAMSDSHARGRQERIIYVKSNDPINPQAEVRIRAYVR